MNGQPAGWPFDFKGQAAIDRRRFVRRAVRVDVKTPGQLRQDLLTRDGSQARFRRGCLPWLVAKSSAPLYAGKAKAQDDTQIAVEPISAVDGDSISNKKQTLLDWAIKVRGLPPMAQKQERAMDGAQSAVDGLRIRFISRGLATPVGD